MQWVPNCGTQGERIHPVKLWSLLSTLFFVSCGLSDDAIRQEIRTAGMCSAASDCVDIGSYCPFGCSVVVHKDEADRIRRLLLGNARNNCLYDCAQLKAITCEAGQCQAKFF